MIPSAALRYRYVVMMLLGEHKMKVPPGTEEFLADTVQKCHATACPPVKQSRKRFQEALTCARFLLRYNRLRNAPLEIVEKRQKELRDKLSGYDAIVWLEIPFPNVRSILHRVRSVQSLDADELPRLIKALNEVLSTSGGRTGAPLKRVTFVIRAVYIAWSKAGRKFSAGWDAPKKRATGALAAFARDFLQLCDIDMNEATLRTALRKAHSDMTKVYRQSARCLESRKAPRRK